jgi:hypothetical protein
LAGGADKLDGALHAGETEEKSHEKQVEITN